MARTLTYATHTLTTSSVPAGTRPISLAGWIRPTTTADNHSLIEMTNSAGSAILLLRLQDTPDLVAQMFVRSNSATNIAVPQSTTNYTINQWHHLVGVWGTTSTTIWLNGAGKTAATNVAADTSLSLDTLRIQPTGDAAEIAVWQGVELDDDDVAQLYTAAAHGFSPAFIHPDHLVAYWPLFNNDSDRDHWGSFDLTAVNAPTYAADHPDISYPAAPHAFTPRLSGDAGPTSNLPAIAAYHRMLHARRRT